MHGNTLRGTREALHLTWHSCQVRTVNPRGTTVMHGYRESDSPIVPTKPANKGRPQGPAEQGEGRGLAKGNVVQHTRSRTQRRGLLSQVLDRVRQALCLRVLTQGRSPVRSCRTPGSVRGALGNRRPYRDRVIA
jgi:hypothetical protein